MFTLFSVLLTETWRITDLCVVLVTLTKHFRRIDRADILNPAVLPGVFGMPSFWDSVQFHVSSWVMIGD